MQKKLFSLPKTFQQEFKVFSTPKDMYFHIKQLTQPKTSYPIRNYIGTIQDINRESIIIETDLFPKDALNFYTQHNMGLISIEKSPELYKKFYNNQRGGGQGDYSFGFQEKFKNIIDCLTKFPSSKRAILTMPYSKAFSHNVIHSDDEEQKCLRELHFFIEENVLHCTGFMRSQARIIFPKNIHFIGTTMLDLADTLNIKIGTLTYFITTLVDGRD